MSASNDHLTLEEAGKVLAAFNGLDTPLHLPPGQQQIVRRALTTVTQSADRLIFGVCADNLESALVGLRAFATALGLVPPDGPELRGAIAGNAPVYCKCNFETGLFYATPYDGEHRGILVVCQGDHPDAESAIYGHLPLNLFA